MLVRIQKWIICVCLYLKTNLMHSVLLGVFCESLSKNYTVVIPNLMVRDKQKCIF